MDFMPQPEEAKKFGTMKWIKWNIYKYPNIFLILLPIPFACMALSSLIISTHKGMKNGTFVPNVIMNRYVVVRPDSFLPSVTPSRYKN